tara:strand:+ start:13267 stop:14262 length:996 start_codon:yes stop_codon:yes gene_type:complete
MKLPETDKTISPAVSVGLIVSMAWVVLVFLYFTFSGQRLSAIFDTSILGLLTMLAVILPLVLIWTAAITAGTALKLKNEARVLRREMASVAENLRVTSERLPKEQSDIVGQLKVIAEMTVKNDRRLKEIANNGVATSAPLDVLELNRTVFGDYQAPSSEMQINLPLSDTPENAPPPIQLDDMIKALNFPDNAKDRDGFRALRRAMEERKLRALLENAQTVIAALTEDGIFMDDLSLGRADVGAWRRFSDGTRGKKVASVGAVKDKAVLGIARARMKTDAEFRQLVMQFLQQFDQLLMEYEPRFQNHDVTDLANTRTARCFMVMARVSGAFE